jgi:CRP/FNR family transcriptional regulator, cyclic AMP receptor protein
LFTLAQLGFDKLLSNETLGATPVHDLEFGERFLRHGWLARTPVDFQRALFPICRLRRYSAGETLYAAGDEPGGIYGLVRGSVCVSMVGTATEMHFVHLLQPGNWFGEGSALTGRPRRVSVVARTDVTVAHATLGNLQTLLAERPEWWRHIGCMAVETNSTSNTAGGDLMIRDPELRCIATIMRLCGCRFEDPEDDVVVTASVSHEELGSMANLARNTVGDILRRLSDRGLVELGYRTIKVRDGDTLRAMVDEN